jgi:hypothetical protein
MLQLDRVTLLGVDCIDIDRLIFAAEVSMKQIQFKAVKLLTHLDSDHELVLNIPPITSIEAYSEFMIKELIHFVETEFVLIIQYDGYVLNPNQWRNTNFDCDYIGAPAFWGIGNGGFSLRSRKLLQILSEENTILNTHPEDVAICVKYRSLLEQKGIRFASQEIAFNFAVEAAIWQDQFGFHNADISSWDIDQFTNPEKHLKYIAKFKNQYKNNTIKLSYVVQFYLENNQNNPIDDLISIYSLYDPCILAQIHFVFVDDGSPIPVVIHPHTNLNYTLIRIEDNIPWNQPGARNIGVTHTQSERIILTDLDIIFPENLLSQLLDFYPPQHAIFKFKTVSNLQVIQPHFNVFFMWKDTFMRTKGVDELFSGQYGYDDVFFYFLNKALGVKFYLFKNSNIVHREHKEKTTSQHNSLVRDTATNKALFDKKMEQLKTTNNPLEVRSPLYLNFSWKIVVEKTYSKPTNMRTQYYK